MRPTRERGGELRQVLGLGVHALWTAVRDVRVDVLDTLRMNAVVTFKVADASRP